MDLDRNPDVSRKPRNISENQKYLGVMVYCKISLGKQIRCPADKAAMEVASHSRLMANVGGQLYSKRTIFRSLINPTLLYGAEV